METSLGERISTLRKLRGLTQEQLAELCNVSSSCVSRWETGKLRPKASRISELARVLDVDETEFYLTPKTPLSNDVIIREIVSYLLEMDYQEKLLFLRFFKDYHELHSKPCL